MASDIRSYLKLNNYITSDGTLTEQYRNDAAHNALKPIPEGFGLTQYTESIFKLVRGIFDETALEGMIDDGKKTKLEINALNDNFKKFQNLWNEINHKYAYKVSFDSDELIQKAVVKINEKLYVSELKYVVTVGEQRRVMDESQVKAGNSFGSTKTRSQTIRGRGSDGIKYDLIGKIAEATTLTRKTIVKILTQISFDKFEMFKINPEEFISKVSKLINDEKATTVVDHITYNQLEGTYDSTIFTDNQTKIDYSKAFKANKHIQDYVVTDGYAEDSVERKMAKDLDEADEVCVYAKLPRTFQIPTPMGNYAPDWAISFKEVSVKHIYFIAETKGTMDSMELRKIEEAKINCAKKLFNAISTSKVRYHDVTTYQKLLDVMETID